MARIKFLDVLEETKRKPSLSYEERPSYSERSEPAERTPRFEQSFQDAAPREPRVRETRLPASFAPRKTEEREDGNLKIVWMASLFIFFGGVLFLGGYWLGQALKREMPRDRIQQEASLVAPVPLPAAALTTPMPAVEPARMPEAAPAPRVIKPLAAVAPKKAAPMKTAPARDTAIGNGEYVIQVSAHTNIEAARANERKLIEKGIDNVYISESYMGDNQKVFRVRVRNGFKTDAQAKKALPEIRAAVGLHETDGKVIKLN